MAFNLCGILHCCYHQDDVALRLPPNRASITSEVNLDTILIADMEVRASAIVHSIDAFKAAAAQFELILHFRTSDST